MSEALTELADAVERDDGTGIYDLVHQAMRELPLPGKLNAILREQIDYAARWGEPDLLLGAIALMLPEGWEFEVASYGAKGGGPRAALWRNLYLEEFDVEIDAIGSAAITPAHALLAAICRAHEEVRDEPC